MVTQDFAGGAKGDDFGVSGGVVVGEVAIPSAGDDLVVVDHDGSYGDVTRVEGTLGGAESFFHPEFVVGRWLVVRRRSLVVDWHVWCAFAF
jgi:hypothetical protein